MKASIEVCLVHAISTIQFHDDDSALVAYAKVSDALANLKKYSNEKTETVEIETMEGKCTLRLESIQSIVVNKAESYETMMRDKLMNEKRAREIREELGLPPLER